MELVTIIKAVVEKHDDSFNNFNCRQDDKPTNKIQKFIR